MFSCARTVGEVAGDVQCRRDADIQRHAAEALIKVQLQHHVGAEHRLLLFHNYHHELCLYRGLCSKPLPCHLESDQGVGQHHDI